MSYKWSFSADVYYSKGCRCNKECNKDQSNYKEYSKLKSNAVESSIILKNLEDTTKLIVKINTLIPSQKFEGVDLRDQSWYCYSLSG